MLGIGRLHAGFLALLSLTSSIPLPGEWVNLYLWSHLPVWRLAQKAHAEDKGFLLFLEQSPSRDVEFSSCDAKDHNTLGSHSMELTSATFWGTCPWYSSLALQHLEHPPHVCVALGPCGPSCTACRCAAVIPRWK